VREQERKLKDRLDAGPTPSDFTCAFHGKDIQDILHREFGVVLKLSAVYWLLHQMGYSRLCPHLHRSASKLHRTDLITASFCTIASWAA
jgi:transposase